MSNNFINEGEEKKWKYFVGGRKHSWKGIHKESRKKCAQEGE